MASGLLAIGGRAASDENLQQASFRPTAEIAGLKVSHSAFDSPAGSVLHPPVSAAFFHLREPSWIRATQNQSRRLINA